MSEIASPITTSCGLATNALRRNDGSAVGCPPHQRPKQSTASAASRPSAFFLVAGLIVSCEQPIGRPDPRGHLRLAGPTSPPGRVPEMPEISSTTAPNDLPVHRVKVAGTRALTALVAFDAGARSERPDENGVAHFLEHLIFKGGERFAHYRDVNETAERMGAMINAYTSHDLVAFHITCRAEVAREALDLLTDIAGRP